MAAPKKKTPAKAKVAKAKVSKAAAKKPVAVKKVVPAKKVSTAKPKAVAKATPSKMPTKADCGSCGCTASIMKYAEKNPAMMLVGVIAFVLVLLLIFG